MQEDEENTHASKLEQCIENFRLGIKDQNTSFNAMDTKTSVFIATLGVLLVLLMQSIFGMNTGSYHPACQIIIYVLGLLVFISITINLILGFLTIRGRRMRNGVLGHATLNALDEKGSNIQEEVCAKLSEAYAKNKPEYDDKVKIFLRTQGLWIANLIASLVFMLILTVIKLSYEQATFS